MSEQAGHFSRLRVSSTGGAPYTLLGCVQSLDFDGNFSSIDTTCHEDGADMTSIPGKREATFSVEGIRDVDDAGQAIVHDAYFGTGTIALQMRMKDGTGFKDYEVLANVENFTLSGPNDDAGGFSSSFKQTGAPTITTQV